MTPTEKYIKVLGGLKSGDLGLLRAHSGQGLDESVEGFDLFTGLWWPLREKNQSAPRREVAWLIAKLYAAHPILQSEDDMFARQMGRFCPKDEHDRERFRQKFDELLTTPLGTIETALRCALEYIHSQHVNLDWVALTDDLSIWERENTRHTWAEQFLDATRS